MMTADMADMGAGIVSGTTGIIIGTTGDIVRGIMTVAGTIVHAVAATEHINKKGFYPVLQQAAAVKPRPDPP